MGFDISTVSLNMIIESHNSQSCLYINKMQLDLLLPHCLYITHNIANYAYACAIDAFSCRINYCHCQLTITYTCICLGIFSDIYSNSQSITTSKLNILCEI